MVLSSGTAYLLELLLTKKKRIMDFQFLLELTKSSFHGISNEDFEVIEELLFETHRIRAAWMISVAATAVHAAIKETKLVNKKVSFSSSSSSVADSFKIATTLFSSLFLKETANLQRSVRVF